MPFPKAIITKPLLVTTDELKDLGQNINLVGYDSFGKSIENTNQYVSPRLLNWIEPYEISGFKKTLFYTEVNSNLMVGDRVFIINGNYDNNNLIKKDKYKKGRDGYKVLKVDNCKIVLDIDYTGLSPQKDDSLDDYIKVYYIENKESFLSVNRQVTTRGGNFDYKFNYGQNNIAFVDSNYSDIDNWGLNAGIVGSPGFFVRDKKEVWSNISDDLIYLGSFSVALSETYGNNGKILVQDGDFVYNGIQFKEGFAYKWEIGPTGSNWMVDVEYSKPIITKANFRNGTFNGNFNTGLYGTQESKIEWSGKGTWNGGTILNSIWKSGTMNSKIDIIKTFKTSLDEKGYPFQKSYGDKNGGFGFNYVIDSELESSLVSSGNFLNTNFKQHSATFSIVENHILSITQSFDNNIENAYIDMCKFENIEVKGGELRNVRAVNSKFTNVKLVNSYIKKSVVKDSVYIGDGVVKILGYDEWNMSEYFKINSGEFSNIKDVNQKIYKFYISKESYKRFKSEDTFYIKGLKINDGTKKILNFFDTKFRLTSWTEFYDDYATDSSFVTGVDQYSFHKRGYEMAAFLSTPEENSYIINSYETEYWYKAQNESVGSTHSKYNTKLVGKNPNSGYSIDIIVARHDIVSKNIPMDQNSEWESLNPKNYNYDSDVLPGTASLPTYLGDLIDISDAYILDADFESGIIETSDWNSGHHINYNNDVVITSVTSSGAYSLEIDYENNLLIANTSEKIYNPEKIGVDVLSKGEIVFLNSVDYDTTGQVTKVTVISNGTSYSTSDMNRLVNTSILSTTMSSPGTNYFTGNDIKTISNKSGTGVTVDIVANPIGAVIGITYSAPLSGGGSYSMTFVTTSINRPIGLSFSTDYAELPLSYVNNILTDDALGTITGITPAQNGGFNATYSVFGPPQTAMATGATGVGVIFVTGSSFRGGGMTVNYKTSTNGSITNLYINNSGVGYLPGQTFRVDGGNATFSITSVSNGEIISYKIKNKGEDYINGEVLQIQRSFDPNSIYNSGISASIVISSITASVFDEKGLTLDITTGSGVDDGKLIDIGINNPGLYYTKGEIFTILGGNLDAIVRIESVTGSLTRIGDTYKVIENNSGVISLQELGTYSLISGLTAGGIFYTSGAKNRWGYISKSKFDRTNIKSGILRRAYITNSLIGNIDYDSTDKDFSNYDKIKSLLITDTLFSNNSNILSSATYLYSNIVGGSDIWNDGIVFKSLLNGMTFSKGVVSQSIWLGGNFKGGVFYDSKSFDAKPTDIKPNYLSNRVRSYFLTGELGPGIFNSRYSWQNGVFSGGEFYKSDWENGTFKNGLFYYSKFYNGVIDNGTIGTKDVATIDTQIYNGKINYATVENAYVYATDTSYNGASSSSITWIDGVFNNGVFGSNNDDIIGTTVSNITLPSLFPTLPIRDFKLTSYTQSVSSSDIILNDLEITCKINLKHTYIGDLIINLMSPNGSIINLKKRYSGGSSDNLVETTFTNDLTKPSLEISTAPHTGEFTFANVLNHGVYYKLDGTLLENVEYQESKRTIPQVVNYGSFPPSNSNEGDRYLVIATSSDPNWNSTRDTKWNLPVFTDRIVEQNPSGVWVPIIDTNLNGDLLYIKERNIYLKYITTTTTSFSYRKKTNEKISAWVKSYHSNTTNSVDLMNDDKTIKGIWTLLVMDATGYDIGFVDDFTLNFKYKNDYIIRSFKNDAVWHNGIFNGGQFIDLAVWKNGKFNGGKFISTYGYSKSGNYLIPNKNKEDYSWHAGEFNGGEFGNESSLINSTWFNGIFGGGVFKGKLWNNGVFLYGEFKGGSNIPAIGSDNRGSSASTFVDQFRNGNYGVWMGGIVSDKKDSFVTNQKIFTTPTRATNPVISNKKAIFTNMLWLSGTFNHPSGEIKNSVWFDGLFQMGRFESSSFNPYVKRYSDNLEFLKDDSCIWENGKLVDSEFFFSKWNYGHFISGTATGMIWKDGIVNYMNAYNIFWENGVWRNGNWNGSAFEYSGKVIDGFAKEILNRGIEWSGTNSCHVWNIFETDADKTKLVNISNNLDTFSTDNQEDSGNNPPTLNDDPIFYSDKVGTGTITYTILYDGGALINQSGIVWDDGGDPGIKVVNFVVNGLVGSTISPYDNTAPNLIPVISGPTSSKTITLPIYGSIGVEYSVLGYATNEEGTGYNKNMLKFHFSDINKVTYISPKVNQLAELMDITVDASYLLNNTGFAAPTEVGVVYSLTNTDPKINSPGVTKKPGVSSFLNSWSTEATIQSIIAMSSLSPAKTYYIRAYAINQVGVGYSDMYSVTAGIVKPTVILSVPNPIQTSTGQYVDLSGSIGYTGGSTTLKRGFVFWKTSLNITNINNHPNTYATLTDFVKVDVSDGINAFNSSISNLTPNTSYSVKAFAYSSSVNTIFAWDTINPITKFVTKLNLPSVKNGGSAYWMQNGPSNLNFATEIIMVAYATSGGYVGAMEIGFVYTNNYSNYPIPTVSGNNGNIGKFFISSNSIGTSATQFEVKLTGLVPGQKYYYNAYAKHSTLTGVADKNITTIDANTNTSVSTVATFTTSATILITINPGVYELNIPAGNITINNVNSTILEYGIICVLDSVNTSSSDWWPGNIIIGNTMGQNIPDPVVAGFLFFPFPLYPPNHDPNILVSRKIKNILFKNSNGIISNTDKIGNLLPNTKYRAYAYIKNDSTRQMTTYDSTYSNGIYTKVDALTLVSNVLNYINQSRISNYYKLVTYLSSTYPTSNATMAQKNVGTYQTRVLLKTEGVHIVNGTDDIGGKGFQVSNSSSFTEFDTYQSGLVSMVANSNGLGRGGFTMSVPDGVKSFLNGKKYSYRSFWNNSSGTSYGATASFYTCPVISGNINWTETTTTSTLNRVTTAYIDINNIKIKNVDVPIDSYGVVWTSGLNTFPDVSIDPVNQFNKYIMSNGHFRHSTGTSIEDYYGATWQSQGESVVADLPFYEYPSFIDKITIGNSPTTTGYMTNPATRTFYARIFVRVVAGGDDSNNTKYLWHYGDLSTHSVSDPNAYNNPLDTPVVSIGNVGGGSGTPVSTSYDSSANTGTPNTGGGGFG